MAKPNLNQFSKTAACPACNGLVACGIKACIHCGYANPAPIKKEQSDIVKIGGVILLILFLMLLFKSSPNASSRATSSDDNSTASESAKETAATMINLNGKLCAKVTDLRPAKNQSDTFEITCTEYRDGTGTVHYLLDSNTGKILR